MTLEQYFAQNKAEWDDAVAQIKESGEGIMDVEMSVSGNEISQIMTFTQTFGGEQVAAMKAELEKQAGDLKEQVSDQIRTMEQAAGIDGITWHFEYRNGDGEVIGSFDIGSN